MLRPSRRTRTSKRGAACPSRSFAVSAVCESVTSPVAAAQIGDLSDKVAAEVLNAIEAIELNPGTPGLLLEDTAHPGNFLCLVMPVAIGIRWLDDGAAFEVLSVRSVFVG